MTIRTKFDDEISLKYGFKPYNRPIEELLDKRCIILNKDCELTYHKAVENNATGFEN